jgi:membrane protein DedA with SNARE-associated domain/rhodanese-related sulfurtransferase
MNSQPSIGYISLLLVVFGRQLCLPLPADLLLVAAGALVAGGRMSLPLVLCIGVSGCLAGDLVWFRVGRRWGSKVLHILCNFTGDPVRCTQRAHTSFARWGLKLLLIAKFIPGMGAIAPPIAGMEGSSLPSFVALDAVGSLLWSGFYVGLGFYFSHKLTIASRVASHFAIALALLIGCPLAIMVTCRITKLFHMIRRLRLRTISPHSLREKLGNGGTIALIDLLNFEEAGPAVEGIPGAVRIAPARLRIRDEVFMPKDVEVVLYCSSPREFTSARVTLALLRRGIANVFVLDGGLNAWKAEGYPVTTALSSSTESHAKLGIRLLKPRGSESDLPKRIVTIVRNLFR